MALVLPVTERASVFAAIIVWPDVQPLVNLVKERSRLNLGLLFGATVFTYGLAVSCKESYTLLAHGPKI